MSSRRAIQFLIAISFLLYLPALFGDFVFDDRYLILENAPLQSPGGIRNAFTVDYYGQSNPQYALGYYRPLSLATHWFDWQVWGNHPFGHHLTNVLLHSGTTVLLYLLLLVLFESAPLALLASTIFAVHPSHAGTIAFISGRVDALATLFSLGCLYAFCRRRALAGPLYFAALLSKEISITTPALAFLREWERSWRRAAFAMIPFVVVLAIVFWLRWTVLGSAMHLAPSFHLQSLWMLPSYLRFLVCPPFRFYLEPTIPLLPMLPTLISFALYLIGLILLVDKKVAKWCAVWLITLLPVLGFLRIETVMDERYLYYPSIGFCLLAGGWVLQYLRYRNKGSDPAPSNVWTAVIVIVLVYSPLLLVREAYWHNDLSLWQSAAETDPLSGKVRLRLGVANLEAGDPGLAEQQFEFGLSLPPQSSIYTAALYTHLATARQIQGKDKTVEELYRRALALEPSYYTAHLNLGLFYKNHERNKDAEQEFKAALQSNPNSTEARRLLGTLQKNPAQK